MTPKDGRRRAPQDRRRQILFIAAECFRTHGIEDATFTEIARRAGVTRNLVYHYFPKKLDLIEAVFEHEALVFLDRLPVPVPLSAAAADTHAALVGYLEQILLEAYVGRSKLRIYLGHPDSEQLLYTRTTLLFEELAERVMKILRLPADAEGTRKVVNGFMEFFHSFLIEAPDEIYLDHEKEWANYFASVLQVMLEKLPAFTSFRREENQQ